MNTSPEHEHAAAVDRWRNSEGFTGCDESDCFEDVYTLASAYIARLDADAERERRIVTVIESALPYVQDRRARLQLMQVLDLLFTLKGRRDGTQRRS